MTEPAGPCCGFGQHLAHLSEAAVTQDSFLRPIETNYR